MNHQEMNIIELIDENSEVISFEHIMTLDYAEREYIVLSPVDQESDSDEDEIVILRVEQDENGEDILVGIDDGEELDTVVEAYEELAKQQNN